MMAVRISFSVLGVGHFSRALLDHFCRAPKLRPGVAYSVAGKVNSADKLYLVLESVRLDTKHPLASTTPVPADGAGGSGIG